MKAPTVSAVVPAYNAERYIAETLAAVFAQTHPPNEVIVVDDGSTDGTLEALAPFSADIRVVSQANRGIAGAMNRCFEEARCAYVAKCDADDIWEPEKLERQIEAVQAHPEIDVAFTGISLFGEVDGSRGLHSAGDPSEGILDGVRLARTLYRECAIWPSSTLIRRDLFGRLGPFAEELLADDYDYWMRALREGAVFYYDPAELVRYRRHERQQTSDVLVTREAVHEVHTRHTDLIDDRRFVRAVLADDFFRIGRLLVDQGEPREARRAFRRSLRYGQAGTAVASARAAMWIAILSLPTGAWEQAGRALVRLSRGIDNLVGVRQPTSP